jgi:beta-aspartyl-peptidase (threonine type)
VGAVALDQAGHLAAATSTGGRTGKWPGRVGDTPLLGAGTYANDATAAISCTGNGEYFMRLVTAHALSARMAFGSASLHDAAAAAVADLGAAGGTGGLIAVGRDGSVALPYNTAGMYRGVARADGSIEIAI